MIRGIYISASGMLTQQVNMDLRAENMANFITTGYRRQAVAFAPYLQASILRYEAEPRVIGQTNLGTVTTPIITDLSAGPLAQTDFKGDLALEGDGFFTVERDGEFLYTRNGSFRVDGDGYLVTRNGDRVLGQNGFLRVGNMDFRVTADGLVISASGEELDRLRLTRLPGGETVQRTMEGYLAVGNGQTEAALDTTVWQGFLEGSNANFAEEMVALMEVARIYQANQRLLRTHDELMSKAVNQVGALR